MSSLVHVELTLTPYQIERLAKGHNVQIPAKALQEGKHALRLHHLNAHKVHMAKKAQKGVRLQLSHDELHGSGILDWIKNAGQWIKSNIIDTDVYQKAVRPAVKELIKTGISALPVQGLAKEAVQRVADIAGDKSGAFGMKKMRHHRVSSHGPLVEHLDGTMMIVEPEHQTKSKKGRPHKAAHHPQFMLSDNYSTVVGPDHPSAWPSSATLPPPGLKLPKRGGSFRAA